MAFVIESERNFNFNKESEENELGPGEYLPITNIHKISENKIPFNSSESKLKFKANNNPGPGSYYKDISKEEEIKRKENKKMEIINKIDEIKTSNIILSPYDPETKKEFQAQIRIKKNYEKYGFSIKEKRFKTFENEIPGPGSFFNNKYEKEEKKIKEKIKNNKNKLQINNNDKFFNIKKAPFNIDSIPQKISFGYEEKNNKLIKRDNPNKFKIFSGIEGEDQIGPGTYDIDFPEYWKKKGTNWSKNKTLRNFQNKNIIRPKTSYNINHINCTQGNFRNEENKNNNINNNFRHLNWEIYKSYNNNKNNIIPNKEISYLKGNDNPGPGSYFNNINFFKKASQKGINKNYFYSSCDRFGKGLNSPVEITIKTTDDLQSFYNPLNDQKLKKKKKNKTPPNKSQIGFLSQSSRFPYDKKSKSNNNNLNDSDTKKNNKNIFSNKVLNNLSLSTSQSSTTTYEKSSKGRFYRRDIRFREAEIEERKRSENPGPGSYINPFSNTGNLNTININGRFVDLRTGNNILNKERPKTSINNNNLQRYEYINFNNNPGVGKYNNYDFGSIQYFNEKNYSQRINYNNNNTLGFNSSDKGKRNESLKKEKIGPGSYIKRKFVNQIQIEPAFHSSAYRSVLDKKLKKNFIGSKLGPGQYDIENKWIKQSFNIKYL